MRTFDIVPRIQSKLGGAGHVHRQNLRIEVYAAHALLNWGDNPIQLYSQEYCLDSAEPRLIESNVCVYLIL